MCTQDFRSDRARMQIGCRHLCSHLPRIYDKTQSGRGFVGECKLGWGECKTNITLFCTITIFLPVVRCATQS